MTIATKPRSNLQGDITEAKIQPTLFDPIRIQWIEIPPDWANSNASVDVVTRVQFEPTARRFGWSGPFGEEFALDIYASATTMQSC